MPHRQAADGDCTAGSRTKRAIALLRWSGTNPRQPCPLSGAFRVLAKQNALEDVTPHALRHAWVSQMIALGFDAVTIATMTGHSPDVLLRVYAHAFDRRKREAVEALAEARRAARTAS